MHDIGYGWRSLRRNPGFTLTAIVTLALGIGAAVMVFSVVNAILFDALPYQTPDRLVAFEVGQANYSGPPDYGPDEFRDFKSWMPSLEDAIGFANTNLLYRNGLGAQEVRGAWVSINTFSVLGVSPRLGRYPTAADENGCAIGDRFWREQFQSDPNVLGMTLNFDGAVRIVTGVMPPRFRFADADVWIPTSGSADVRLFPIGRLKAGATVESAARDFDAAARRMSDAYQYPGPKQFTVSVRTLIDSTVGSLRQALYVVFAAVGLLLLIACVNVGNLLLVRATAREKEIAIRGALGASRGRLIRQLLVESFLLASAGGVGGAVLAWWVLGRLALFLPPGAIPSEVVIEMNGVALGFAVALTLITTILCGLAPALRATRGQPTTRLRGGLVVAEVALSMVLLIGAGLMARTFFAITHVDLGFDAANVLHLRLVLPRGRYDDSLRQQTLMRDVLEKIRQTPGVTSATVSRNLPPLDEGSSFNLDIPGKPLSEPWRAMLAFCDENYFRTLGRSLQRGRLFGETDSIRQVMVVNEAFARAYFRGDDPIGRTVHFDFRGARGAPLSPNFEVIGVVSDARNQGPREPILPQGYLPYHGDGFVLVKTNVPPSTLIETIRRQIWAADPEVAMARVGTIEQSIDDSDYAQPRFGLVSIGGFASVGLVLIAVGVFSVMAYSVSMRTREIGIRMALGAVPEHILGLVLGQGLGLVAVGVAIGLVASLGLTRLIASQLWGITATDPWTFTGVTAILLISGLAACFFPALRAARVDPKIALRHE